MTKRRSSNSASRTRSRLEEAEDLEERIVARYCLPLGGIIGGVSEVFELSAAARRHAQLVILGDPGSGKSTLLRYLAPKHAQASLKGQADVGAH